MFDDDLAIPEFLKGGHVGLPKTRKRRFKPVRPEGQRWENAVWQEIALYDEAPVLGCGRRMAWVSEGRKWCKLCTADGSKAKIPMAVWAQVARRKSSG